MLFLSIVIPHYNLPGDLLMRCVKSIVDQKMPQGSYEIIIVDDGSHEPPQWLNETFPQEELRVINIAHAGPGAARNKGIEEARGRYIQFIDADDCLQPDSMNRCLKVIHTELPQIFRFHYKICHSERAALESIKNIRLKYSNTISGAAYMEKFNLSGSPCTYIFERSVAMKHNIRFKTDVYHEDEDFNTLLHYHASSLIYSNATIYNYCIRKESITSSTNRDFEKERMNHLILLLKRLCTFRDTKQEKSSNIQKRALKHKITMLTVDTILNYAYNGCSAQEIAHVCDTQLRPLSLYPLPPANYSLKYKIFRMMANNRYGLHILRMIISRKKPMKK